MKANTTPHQSGLTNHNPVAATIGLTKYALKAAMRNRTGLYFSLVFPLVFLSIFGAIGNGTTSTNIGISPDISRNSALYTSLKSLADSKDSPIKLVEGNKADLETKLTQSKVDAVLEPDGLNTQVVTSNNDGQGGAVAQAIINSMANQVNLGTAHRLNPSFTEPISLTNRELSGRPYNYIDFALPGQLGFALMSLATFGVAFPFITLRKTLVLKRMFATSIRPIEFIISQCLSRSVQALITSAVLIATGVFIFHFHLANGWVTALEMFILSVVGVLSFMGFGMLVAGVVKDEQTAPIVLNLVTLPMLLLSGVFFPTYIFPGWLQKIGNNLPLGYLATALRKVANEGAGLHAVLPYIGGMLLWAVIVYTIAALNFKSEP